MKRRTTTKHDAIDINCDFFFESTKLQTVKRIENKKDKMKLRDEVKTKRRRTTCNKKRKITTFSYEKH